MRILSNIAVSASMNLGSNAKDNFVVGTPDLDNNNVNVDIYTVWANTNFKNDVQLGSNLSDNINVSGTMVAEKATFSNLTSSIVSSSNLYLDEFIFTANTLQAGVIEATDQLSVSGNLYLSGNIIPALSAAFSLGTLEKPFKELYVGSGSISIKSSIIGVVPTVISNNSGNLEISAGGMKLLGTGSFIAATGSFSYVSGNVTWQGDNTTNGKITANTLHVKNNLIFDSGNDKPVGTAQLNGGNPASVTITNNLVTTSSVILFSKQTNLHNGEGNLAITKSSGSFTIYSNHNGDTDIVGYFIINN
jgi:hypothetical protein